MIEPKDVELGIVRTERDGKGWMGYLTCWQLSSEYPSVEVVEMLE